MRAGEHRSAPGAFLGHDRRPAHHDDQGHPAHHHHCGRPAHRDHAVDDPTTHDAEWVRWRREREDTLRAPHGWLSVTALHWLTAQPTVLAGLPGRWASDGVSVTVTAGDGLVVDGAPVPGGTRLTPAEGGPGVLVTAGGQVAEVVLRTGSHAVRVRDPQAPARLTFTEVPTYAPNPDWVRPARFTAYPSAQTVTTGAVVAGLHHHHSARGTLAFTAPDGSRHTLVAFAAAGGGLSVLFADATSGVSTYPACRSLAVAEPDPDGATVLDFTRALNLPCAFTDHATCPVAPPENRLSVAVEAGERWPVNP